MTPAKDSNSDFVVTGPDEQRWKLYGRLHLYDELRPEHKIRLAIDILWQICDEWDDNPAIEYPKELPSFDEYLAEIGSKLYHIYWS